MDRRYSLEGTSPPTTNFSFAISLKGFSTGPVNAIQSKTVNNIIFHHLGNPMVLNKTLITGVLILCLVVFSQARAQNNSLFSPVIKVNDTVVTKFEYDQRVKFLSALKFPGDPTQVALTQLIEERLKHIEALKLQITASESEIEDEL